MSSHARVPKKRPTPLKIQHSAHWKSDIRLEQESIQCAALGLEPTPSSISSSVAEIIAMPHVQGSLNYSQHKWLLTFTDVFTEHQYRLYVQEAKSKMHVGFSVVSVLLAIIFSVTHFMNTYRNWTRMVELLPFFLQVIGGMIFLLLHCGVRRICSSNGSLIRTEIRTWFHGFIHSHTTRLKCGTFAAGGLLWTIGTCLETRTVVPVQNVLPLVIVLVGSGCEFVFPHITALGFMCLVTYGGIHTIITKHNGYIFVCSLWAEVVAAVVLIVYFFRMHDSMRRKLFQTTGFLTRYNNPIHAKTIHDNKFVHVSDTLNAVVVHFSSPLDNALALLQETVMQELPAASVTRVKIQEVISILSTGAKNNNLCRPVMEQMITDQCGRSQDELDADTLKWLSTLTAANDEQGGMQENGEDDFFDSFYPANASPSVAKETDSPDGGSARSGGELQYSAADVSSLSTSSTPTQISFGRPKHTRRLTCIAAVRELKQYIEHGRINNSCSV